MTAAGNISYTWDDAGNMATKVANQQTTTYTWDFRNMMVEVDFPTGDDVSLRYDGDGSRYRKEVGTTTTKYLFDGPALGCELDGSDTLQAEYRRAAGGRLLAMGRGTALSTYHFDGTGSTRGLTNGSETTTDTYEYDAWGNVTASSGTTANPAQFRGRAGLYADEDLGLAEAGGTWLQLAGGPVPLQHQDQGPPLTLNGKLHAGCMICCLNLALQGNPFSPPKVILRVYLSICDFWCGQLFKPPYTGGRLPPELIGWEPGMDLPDGYDPSKYQACVDFQTSGSRADCMNCCDQMFSEFKHRIGDLPSPWEQCYYEVCEAPDVPEP
jgi:hypothetical protein